MEVIARACEHAPACVTKCVCVCVCVCERERERERESAWVLGGPERELPQVNFGGISASCLFAQEPAPTANAVCALRFDAADCSNKTYMLQVGRQPNNKLAIQHTHTCFGGRQAVSGGA